jgi:pimeloyl-ACP methyl ester carboxylesterase
MGPIEDAVEELDRVVAFCRREFPGAPIALIGHSRGGLVARLWLRHAGPGAASALITLASPHEGSTLARWADVFRPIGKNLERRFPRKTYGGLPETALGRIIDFLGSTGVEELVPDGPVAAALADRPAPVTVSASFGGSDPLLFGAGQGRGRGRWGIPSSLRGLVPDTWWPDEWTDGQGDGLVTVKSSVLPGGRYHRTTGCNHVTIAFVESVAEDVRRLLVSM